MLSYQPTLRRNKVTGLLLTEDAAVHCDQRPQHFRSHREAIHGRRTPQLVAKDKKFQRLRELYNLVTYRNNQYNFEQPTQALEEDCNIDLCIYKLLIKSILNIYL